MNVTIAVVAYTWKRLKNNEIPLYLRVTKDRKKKHIGLGISVKPECWDFTKNQPKRNCPNKEEIQQIIVQKTKEYQEQVLEYKLENKDFTAKTLINKVSNSIKAKAVQDILDIHIDRLKSTNRKGYAATFQLLKNSLIKFRGHLNCKPVSRWHITSNKIYIGSVGKPVD